MAGKAGAVFVLNFSYSLINIDGEVIDHLSIVIPLCSDVVDGAPERWIHKTTLSEHDTLFIFLPIVIKWKDTVLFPSQKLLQV